MRCIDHQPIRRACLAGQGRENVLENAAPAPADKAIIQRLVWPVTRRCIFPLQAVMDHVDDAADHAAIIDARQASRLWKEWLDTAHLPAVQKEQIGHRTPPLPSESHRPSRVKGPGPSITV